MVNISRLTVSGKADTSPKPDKPQRFGFLMSLGFSRCSGMARTGVAQAQVSPTTAQEVAVWGCSLFWRDRREFFNLLAYQARVSISRGQFPQPDRWSWRIAFSERLSGTCLD